MGAIELLTLPARLTLRAFDDVHRIARAADAVPDQIELLLARVGQASELLLRIEAIGNELTALGERLDGRAAELLELGAELNALGATVLVQGAEIERRAGEVAERGAQLVEALPALERAIALAEPLEGIVERVARLADRLPGGARRTALPEPLQS
jgi:hypothetical protein